MHSALCTGIIEHSRRAPVAHRFRYPVQMVYLDLAEAHRIFRLTRWWSNTWPAPIWFRRADYLGDAARPLDECVRDEVELRTGVRPAGPVRMLTHLRQFGFAINPITAYFCFEPDGETVAAIVAEVTNTPWNEKHVYVWPRDAIVPTLTAAGHRCAKVFHVSPFMGMQQTYHVRIVHRANGLAIRLDTEEDGRAVFHAQIAVRKQPLTPGAMRRALVRNPFSTMQVFARIYVQAFRLWRKRAPFFPHPHSNSQETAPHDHEHVNL